jgi:ketosteroid isomerase-like protein
MGVPRLLVPVLLLLLVVLVVAAASEARGSASAAVCDAEGECRPAADFSIPKFKEETTKDEDDDGDGDEDAAPKLKQALTALMKWVVDARGDDELPVALVATWATPEVVVEAQGTPNVPWRGRYEGTRAAAAFLRRLRRGLFAAAATATATLSEGAASMNATAAASTNATLTDDSAAGLQWSTAAAGAGAEVGLVVGWEPPAAASSECGAWLMAWGDAGSGSGVGAKLARLVVHHTRSLACAAAHRTRAQRVFDGAFAHFFRKDYDAFRTSFAPDLVLTWHADPPVGKVFHGNGEEGLMAFIHSRVQIFRQTNVEFDPIVSDESSASYYVVFRPLTVRATGQEFGEVRGLLVIHINEAGLIDQYHMTVLDHRVNAALARSVPE